jgi:hypothetical protein
MLILLPRSVLLCMLQITRRRVLAVSVHVTPDRDKIAQTSTRNNSTTMAPIDEALAAIEALELEKKLVY